MVNVKITRIDVSTGKAQEMTDCVAEEKPIRIFINRRHFATIYCSPSNLKELAIGHLLSQGVIQSLDEIEETELKAQGICEVRLKPDVDLGELLRASKPNPQMIRQAFEHSLPAQPFGKLPKIKSNLIVKASVILACVNRLNSIAHTFRKTGGVHAAALHENGRSCVAFAEDIGRHNAVDKAVGMGALKRIAFSACFLVLTGRMSEEIVLKSARVGVPIVASLAAAIDSGIAAAQSANLTLIGFVRGKRMNVYTHPERIIT